MRIRRATEADEAVLHGLWDEFEAEVPDPIAPEPWEDEWRDTRRDIASGLVFLAEDDDGATGVARAEAPRQGAVHVHLVHVRPRARRQGLAKALLAEIMRVAREQGASHVSLDVLTDNHVARTTWSKLGFEELALYMAISLDALEARLTQTAGATFGSIHVQTDDRDAVQREVDKYRPRISASGQTRVTEPRGGWVGIYDDELERDPTLLNRLAKELSNALGSVVACFTVEQETAVGYSLYDRGSSVDDYLSIPEFRGPLPPGDVIAMAANPRVVQRLTGADPAAVRAVARTADSPADLPPARELAGLIGATMGIQGTERGF